MPCPMVVCLESSETYRITHSDRFTNAQWLHYVMPDHGGGIPDRIRAVEY